MGCFFFFFFLIPLCCLLFPSYLISKFHSAGCKAAFIFKDWSCWLSFRWMQGDHYWNQRSGEEPFLKFLKCRNYSDIFSIMILPPEIQKYTVSPLINVVFYFAPFHLISLSCFIITLLKQIMTVLEYQLHVFYDWIDVFPSLLSSNVISCLLMMGYFGHVGASSSDEKGFQALY